MTAPLEVKTRLRELLGDYRGEYLGTLLRCDVTAILAAIEERDAEIERLKRDNWEMALRWIPPHVAQEATATLTRQLAEAKAHRDEFDRLASVQRERANGLEYQCGVYEKRIEEINARWSRFFAMCGVNDPPSLADAERMFPQHGTDAFLYTLECSQAVLEGHEAMRSKLARYEQAEREIWERTPGWLGEQLPALAAYLAGVEQQRDAMREALREIAEQGCSLFLNAVPRRKTPPFCCDDDEPCDGCLARRALGAL